MYNSAYLECPGDNGVAGLLKIVLISTYDLGRQPFGLASPAAWLRADGHDVTCIDLAVSLMVRSVIARGIAFKFLRKAEDNKRLLTFIQSHSGSTSSVLSKAVEPTVTGSSV